MITVAIVVIYQPIEDFWLLQVAEVAQTFRRAILRAIGKVLGIVIKSVETLIRI